MKLILALDTSTDICSVALGCRQDYVEVSRKIPRQHNQHLLQIVDSVFEVTRWMRNDLACVAFSAGPGSFTGIRMGAAAAQGIALALDVRVYPVPSTLVLARSVSSTLGLSGAIQISRKSHQDLCYVGNVLVEGNAIELSGTEVLNRMGSISRSGNRFADAQWNVSSRDVLHLAEMHEVDWVEPHNALPIYIEDDSPWVKSD